MEENTEKENKKQESKKHSTFMLIDIPNPNGRKILFRAKMDRWKEQRDSYFRRWLEGLPCYCSDDGTVTKFETWGSTGSGTYSIDPDTLCEYTGYMDIHKKKVFEHDIIMFQDTRPDSGKNKKEDFINLAEVVFDDGKWKFANFHDENSAVFQSMSSNYSLEQILQTGKVFGNSFEDWKLLLIKSEIPHSSYSGN